MSKQQKGVTDTSNQQAELLALAATILRLPINEEKSFSEDKKDRREDLGHISDAMMDLKKNGYGKGK